MALADDLLVQALLLKEIDPTRPKQANLRRAISTAYYALFHLLVAACAHRIAPARPVSLRPRIARTLSHAEMRDVCLSIKNNKQGTILHDLLAGGPSQDLMRIAIAFIELQEQRHSADYDLAAVFTRIDAAKFVEKAELAFHGWRRIQASDEAIVFLSALLFAKRWSK